MRSLVILADATGPEIKIKKGIGLIIAVFIVITVRGLVRISLGIDESD